MKPHFQDPFDNSERERELFRARARALPPPALDVNAAIALGEARARAQQSRCGRSRCSQCERASARIHPSSDIPEHLAYARVPQALSHSLIDAGARAHRAIKGAGTSIAKGAGFVAAVHAAAGIYVWMSFGTQVEHARAETPSELAMTVDEPGSDHGICGTSHTLFGVSCESVPATRAPNTQSSPNVQTAQAAQTAQNVQTAQSVTAEPVVCDGSSGSSGSSRKLRAVESERVHLRGRPAARAPGALRARIPKQRIAK